MIQTLLFPIRTQFPVAAALSGASRIQMGAMMAEGRGREHLDLMLTREEWEIFAFSRCGRIEMPD